MDLSDNNAIINNNKIECYLLQYRCMQYSSLRSWNVSSSSSTKYTPPWRISWEYSFPAQSNCLATVFTQMESLRSKNAGYEPSVVGYTSRCLIRHVPGSLVGAGFWTGIGVLQGSKAPILPTFTRNLFFLYTYLALQCPMEAIQGKRSLLHCTLSGGIIGYIGCQRKMLGMPQNIYESIVLHSKGRIRGSAAVSVFYAGAATFLGAFTRGV